MRKFCIILCFSFIVSACSTGIDPYQFADRKSASDTFTLCHSYGCTYRQEVTLTRAQQKQIKRIFRYKSKTVQDERDKIGRALARMETYVTQASGLPVDKAEALSRPEDIGQMDCIDETVNNHQFLVYLEGEAFLKLHTVARPIHRGYFIDGKWPHNTAAIIQQDTQQIFAVDGFYRDSGQPPYFIEKQTWIQNWRPE